KAEGVVVTLTEGKTTRELPASDTSGHTKVALAAADYGVSVETPPELWECATESLSIDAVGCARHVILVPTNQRHLGPLLLNYQAPLTGNRGPLAGTTVEVESGAFSHTFHSDVKGRVDAIAPRGQATVTLGNVEMNGVTLLPQADRLEIPVPAARDPRPRELE